MENKVKKFLISIFIFIFIFNVIPNSAYALSQTKSYESEEIENYAEEVRWYYRKVGNREQKRLWSYTYGYWITDWIWV